jgi:phosphoribosylformylglycinamidine synthase
MNTHLLRACHDPSEGGLAVAIAEMLIGGRLGARVHAPPSGIDAHTWWFAESPARLIVEIHPSNLEAVQAALVDDVHVVATLTSEATLQIDDDTIALDSLIKAFQGAPQ